MILAATPNPTALAPGLGPGSPRPNPELGVPGGGDVEGLVVSVRDGGGAIAAPPTGVAEE